MKDILRRYGISTMGLIIVALGVGVSIKSNLGIAPLSCIPTVLALKFTEVSIGTFTIFFNLLFVLLQVIILGKDFKWEILLQIVPILLFGYLVDGAVWLFDALNSPATNYVLQILLCLGAVVLTAVGIVVEVAGQGWMLPADATLSLLVQRTGASFGTVKVIMDVTLVAITAILSYAFFSLLTGNGATVVIREGTLLQAILTGLCMKVTDPVISRIFGQCKKA